MQLPNLDDYTAVVNSVEIERDEFREFVDMVPTNGHYDFSGVAIGQHGQLVFG